ncbi:hypothetical protein B0T22DRAFT_173171 [Podospora appendiculata]|uniref:Rhodopsin domain-containing protein n=1 Tax=Podospora appendiculata TaxID=314037 RepID=A0AAE0WYH4_9PEZI|nr:hypothetical protein B0T22DRAFT_121145 [Podospora appendiculata]KAK3689512.1 hypothetical protein B0T22DRAFT_173171 [Podospora appendiculata]
MSINPNSTAGSPPTNSTAGPPIPLGIPVSERAANLAQLHYGVTSVLLVLCVLTFGTRMYQRVVPVWKIGADDVFIAMGFILAIADWGMLVPIMVTSPGLLPLDRAVDAGKHSWLAIPIWGLAMTCIKTSIALTLLRIQQKHRAWRIFLFTVIAVQAAYGILNTFFNLVIACRPLAAAWDLSIPGGTCVSVETMRAASNVGSSINITTDVLLSLAPATFLRKLNRPLRERVFVCVLMGMGLFASVSSIIKTIIVRNWGDPATVDDWWAMGVSICTWTALEQLLGVLAACVPALKGILQGCLEKVGVSLNDSKANARSGYYARNAGRSGTGTGTGNAGLSQVGNEMQDMKPARYPRGGAKEVDVEDDEECFDVAVAEEEEGVRVATPTKSTKSMRTGSGSFHRGGRGDLSAEHLPAQAV